MGYYLITRLTCFKQSRFKVIISILLFVMLSACGERNGEERNASKTSNSIIKLAQKTETLSTTEPELTWDIDGDGEKKPLTDGLLALRYLFGFTGNALIDNAVSNGATRTTSEAIEAKIQALINSGALDIDGDGAVKPLTDGLLLLRHLFGFTGNALTSNAIGAGATRTTASEIEVFFIETIQPVADAGLDVSVLEGQTITLDGTESSDQNAGGTLNYNWTPATNLNSATVAQPVFTAPTVSTNTDQVLTLTVTDTGSLTATDTVTITILNLPAQPQNPQASIGDQQVVLTWENVSDATTYDICIATETITDAANCANLQGGVLLENNTSPTELTPLTNGTEYHFVVIPKNDNGKGIVSTEITATPVVDTKWDSAVWDTFNWQ